MISFVQTGFLIACAAAAIPVLVHLLSRWQVRSLELGTVRFLQEVVSNGARQRKVRRWLLLLMRMALVTLLALLFARPFLPERARRDGDRLRIVLIDRSASMGMPGQNGRLIDDAVAAAVDAMAELGSDAQVVWAWFDRRVQPPADATTRPTAPRTVVGDTDYLEALSWARDRVNADPDAIADVVLVTDLQQSGLTAEKPAIDLLPFPSDVPVRIVDVGRSAANNLAITGVTTPAVSLAAQDRNIVSVALFNYGTVPAEEVTLHASAFSGVRTVRLQQSMNLPGGQAREVSLDFGRLEPATWQITVALDVDDDLAADNRRLSAVQVAEPAKVVVLDSGARSDGAAAESFFLVAALQYAESKLPASTEVDRERFFRSRFRADVAFLDDKEYRVFDPLSNPLVIVADAGATSTSAIQQLEGYVHRGGRLLVFAGDGSGGGDTPLAWQHSRLAPGELGLPQRSGAMPFRMALVSGRGSMMQPFEDPQHGDLSRLTFDKMLPVSAADSTDVLAWFDHDRPAVTQHAVGDGRVVWFLSSADASWGSWTMSPLYLPLVQQMAADLLDLAGEGPVRFRTVGDPDLASVSPAKRHVARGSTPPASSSRRSGDKTFTQLGFVQRQDALYVINLPEKESDPARVEPAALAEYFGLSAADAAGVAVTQRTEGVGKRELWPWLAAAAFALCLGEFMLANRTSA